MQRRQGLLTVLLLLILLSAAKAGRNDPRYYQATGSGPDAAAAREDARNALAEQIESHISVRMEDVIEEENQVVKRDFARRQSTSYSQIVLRNVEYGPPLSGPAGITVTARILRSEVAAIFQERKTNIRTYLQNARFAEAEGNLAAALRDYFWAYLLTFTLPDTLGVSLPPLPRAGNAHVLLPEKLNRIFRGLGVRVTDRYRDRDDYLVEIAVDYQGRPVQELGLTYRNGRDLDWVELSDGKALLCLSGEFVDPLVVVRPLVEYAYAEEMDRNRDVALVYETLDIPEFDNSLRVEVDLLPYLDVDCEIRVQNLTVFCRPRVRHLSISEVSWDFGDGERSQVPEPVHTYRRAGKYRLTVRYNDSPQLEVTRTVDLTAGKVTTVASPVVRKRLSESPSTPDRVEKPTSAPALPAPPPQRVAKLPMEPASSVPTAVAPAAVFQAATISDFVARAGELSDEGSLVFGGAGDFESLDGLYCFIFDRDEKRRAVFLYADGQYRSLEDGSRRSDLKKDYPGMFQIWVEILDPALEPEVP
jgi:hypothetical protein